MLSQLDGPQKSILVTGASGFIGSAFLRAAKEQYQIFALARRSQLQAGVPEHPNIEWCMADITDLPRLRQVFADIREQGGVDFVLHLAGYYSFENTDEPEYELTNVGGTKNVLECSEFLEPERFVFASSLVVSEFPPAGEVLTEESPANASFPYARSKRAAEELVHGHSPHFPCSIVRMAATFSDWCEYGPLYMLLCTWLGGKWNARILAGAGTAAQPFVHIDHVVESLLAVLERSERLPRDDLYLVASPEVYSHRDLYEIATRLSFGKVPAPIHVPKPLAAVAVLLRDLWGRLIGRRPFERMWMIRYIDRQLRADDRRTRAELGTDYKPRLSLRRRFPYMLENLAHNTVEWHARNAAVLEPKNQRRSMVIASAMLAAKQDLIDEILRRISSSETRSELPNHRKMDSRDLRWNVELIYNLLMSSVQYGDRMSLLSYARYLACVRRRSGVGLTELQRLITLAEATVRETLRGEPRLRDMEQDLADSLRLTVELAVDEMEAVFETEEEPDLLGDFHVLREADPWFRMPRSQFLQSVIDSIDDSLIIIDPEYRVRMMNRHAHELHLGAAPVHEPIYCYQLTHKRDSPCRGDEHPCPLQEVLERGTAVRVEHTHIDRHSRSFDVDVLASPLLDNDGAIVGVIETTYERGDRGSD